uniref:Uncharacterized protein n=1 Tax=Knipowitschia caucasica TaxID=637954 RepID=A0AAV2JH64_KNICA
MVPPQPNPPTASPLPRLHIWGTATRSSAWGNKEDFKTLQMFADKSAAEYSESGRDIGLAVRSWNCVQIMVWIRHRDKSRLQIHTQDRGLTRQIHLIVAQDECTCSGLILSPAQFWIALCFVFVFFEEEVKSADVTCTEDAGAIPVSDVELKQDRI